VNTGAAISPRALVGLTVAVLAAHFWLLRPSLFPVQVQVRQPARVSTFATRSIRPEPPAPLAEAATQPLPSRPAATRSTARSVTTRGPSETVAAASPTAAPDSPAVAPGPSPDTVAPAARLSFPASSRLNYVVQAQVRGHSRQGQAQLLWRHDGEHYEARLETSNGTRPPRVQHSTGQITAQGLAPLRFSDKSRSEQATHFQRESEQVIFSNNRPPAPLLAGAQDRLSVMLQLAAMLAAEPHRYPAGTTILIQTASTRDAEPSLFTVQGDERLELPGGALMTVKLDRAPRGEFDQRIELWLAPGLDYAPVRLRLTQPNGDWLDQQWSSTDRR
jgi:Protein of unknown function (DUF3108)